MEWGKAIPGPDSWVPGSGSPGSRPPAALGRVLSKPPLHLSQFCLQQQMKWLPVSTAETRLQTATSRFLLRYLADCRRELRGRRSSFTVPAIGVPFRALCLARGRCLKQWAASRMHKLASLPTCWVLEIEASLSNYQVMVGLSRSRKASVFVGHAVERIRKGISREDQWRTRSCAPNTGRPTIQAGVPKRIQRERREAS